MDNMNYKNKAGTADNTPQTPGTYAVDLQNASVRFNLSAERIDTLKEYFIRFIKHRLKFQEFYPVRDISLRVMPGESWGFVGVNGSGKSTLLRLICGILKPYRGTVDTNGIIAPLIELGSGIDPELTGRKNIYLNGAMLGLPVKYIEQKFDEIVEFSELQDFLDVPVKNYSSGMKSRLGFSVATSVKPDILIVDEVLAVGDYAFQKKCQRRMAQLREGGTTLLYVSHSIASVLELCDHAMWLDKGHCMIQGNVEEVCRAYMDHFPADIRAKK